ncbi:MAG: PKD domain-containing protein [Saprospiraceae bacterium]|nr:PKD domain-containing protein [Saprospiraceae bacterium]
MKYLLNLMICLLSTICLQAQKHDFIWLSGYGGGMGSGNFGLIKIDFHEGNPIMSYRTDKAIDLQTTNTGISNFDGKLRYYSNGDILIDYNLELVPNAQNLSRVDKERGIPIDQCALFLPYPDKPEHYVLLYPNDTVYRIDTFGGAVAFNGMKVLTIKFDSTHESHQILSRDSLLTREYILEGGFTAVRHANGRDWWIMVFERSPSTFVQRYILDPSGFKYAGTQNLIDYIRNGVSNAAFSPNGRYLSIISGIGQKIGTFLYLLTFDRCKGDLNLILKENLITRGLFYGVGFSPDSRYLYWGHSYKIYQMDLADPDILGSAILLDTIDPIPNFGMSWAFFRNGPDGRLYSGTGYGQPYLHVVEKPNLRGKASIPRRMGIPLKVKNNSTPNFPNYRVGPIEGSVCDTLGIDNVPWAWWRYDQDTAKYRCFEFVDLSGYLTEESEPEWYWDLGDGTQSRDTSPIHCYEKDGIYEVCLIVKNKYGADTLCRTLHVGTSGTNDEGKIGIKTDLLPNPASDHFVLNVHDYLPERMYLHLVNAQRQTVYTQRLYQGSNVIDTHALPPGLYSALIYERGILVKAEKLVLMGE